MSNGSAARHTGRRSLILGAVLGALAVVFAVLNLDEVGVNWIVGTWNTPLIVVIVLSLAIGGTIGWLGGRRSRES